MTKKKTKPKPPRRNPDDPNTLPQTSTTWEPFPSFLNSWHTDPPGNFFIPGFRPLLKGEKIHAGDWWWNVDVWEKVTGLVRDSCGEQASAVHCLHIRRDKEYDVDGPQVRFIPRSIIARPDETIGEFNRRREKEAREAILPKAAKQPTQTTPPQDRLAWLEAREKEIRNYMSDHLVADGPSDPQKIIWWSHELSWLNKLIEPSKPNKS